MTPVKCGLVAAVLAVAGLSVMAQSAPVVDVTGGQIRGEYLPGGGAVFRGVPYAHPPTGDFRWRAPAPVVAWSGVRDARVFGAICPQQPSVTLPNAPELISEDCLSLNVWTSEWPVTEARRPVLLRIPGGGNINGGTSEARYDGHTIARRGIVVVTINYRLGSFGFFSHPALTAESPRRASGNQGLLDQVAALEWVHANITRFGGDPTAITLAGSSAGGIDIGALMTSPLTKGRFARASIESGPARNALGDPLPLDEAERQGAAHAARWGVQPARFAPGVAGHRDEDDPGCATGPTGRVPEPLRGRIRGAGPAGSRLRLRPPACRTGNHGQRGPRLHPWRAAADWPDSAHQREVRTAGRPCTATLCD